MLAGGTLLEAYAQMIFLFDRALLGFIDSGVFVPSHDDRFRGAPKFTQ